MPLSFMMGYPSIISFCIPFHYSNRAFFLLPVAPEPPPSLDIGMPNPVPLVGREPLLPLPLRSECECGWERDCEFVGRATIVGASSCDMRRCGGAWWAGTEKNALYMHVLKIEDKGERREYWLAVGLRVLMKPLVGKCFPGSDPRVWIILKQTCEEIVERLRGSYLPADPRKQGVSVTVEPKHVVILWHRPQTWPINL